MWIFIWMNCRSFWRNRLSVRKVVIVETVTNFRVDRRRFVILFRLRLPCDMVKVLFITVSACKWRVLLGGNYNSNGGTVLLSGFDVNACLTSCMAMNGACVAIDYNSAQDCYYRNISQGGRLVAKTYVTRYEYNCDSE